MTDSHEMRRCHDGRVRAIYTDSEGCEYAVIDGERDYAFGRVLLTCRHCGKEGHVADDETDPDIDDDELALDSLGVVEPNYYVCGECLSSARD